MLARRAPWAAAEIDPGDRQRIVRALELFDAGELEPPDRGVRAVDRRRAAPDAAGRARDGARALYARIDARVDEMLAAGVEAEVRRANAAGASDTARKALGFDELLAGDVDAMKRRTRNYARRQLTWMRKLASVHELDVSERDPEAVAEEVLTLWLTGAAVNGYRITAAARPRPRTSMQRPAFGRAPMRATMYAIAM